MLPSLLDPIEVRVLGSLLEKESTTPEYYPMTLNALVNACNQKSNRYPVVAYDDQTVSQALELLRQKRFASTIISGGRAQKYAQRMSETLNLGRRELALLCTLMLRGSQTLGELRDRSDRMFHFEDLTQVEIVLEHLSEAELAIRLPRSPGQKESRYAHLLSGVVQADSQQVEDVASLASDRFGALESEVADLRERVRRLEELLEN
ncbi:MAG: YceH family protein [Acidobacteriota bacterium]|nr:YceH family protein [Acidobacteriota bacterium]